MSDIGSFLLKKPKVGAERIDEVRPYDRDVCQDALERTIGSLKRRGLTYDVVHKNGVPRFLDNEEHAGLAACAHGFAIKQARRELYRRPKVVSLEKYTRETEGEFMRDDEIRDMETLMEGLYDDWSQDCFDRIDADASSELRIAFENGDADTKRAIHIMCECLALKDRGIAIPNLLRQQLKRLRKQTGLPLDLAVL